MQAIIEAAIAANNQRNEQIIRHLLGRWVSELKPAIAYDQGGNILGITMAEAEIGSTPFMLTVDRQMFPDRKTGRLRWPELY